MSGVYIRGGVLCAVREIQVNIVGRKYVLVAVLVFVA